MRRNALVLCLALSCTTAPKPAPEPGHRELHLLFTTDEHGWLAPLADKKANIEKGGVVNLLGKLHAEGYDTTAKARAKGFLLLSGGDSWTGPFESMALEGAPMLAAMNQMGYAAAAVGNHEFDFGLEILAQRAKEAQFPLLAANIVETERKTLPQWARPFAIIDVGGMKLGVVGLTTTETPITSDPALHEGLTFEGYAATLDKWIPVARAQGAEEIVVVMHEAFGFGEQLLPTLRKHKVRAVSFGHHHVQAARTDPNGTPDVDDDVLMCNGGAYMRGYCRVDLVFEGRKLVAHKVKTVNVEAPLGTAAANETSELHPIVANAEKQADEIGGEVLVENVRLLPRGVDGPLGQFVVDAWLRSFPRAHIAMTNAGSVRQDLAAGEVRVRDIVSVLPFNNTLFVVDVTGAQLKAELQNHADISIVGGLKFSYKETVDGRVVTSMTDRKGFKIGDKTKLKIVISDFMYRGGDGFQWSTYDADPDETETDWRDPVFRTLRDMKKKKKKLDVTAEVRAKKQ